MSRLKGLRLILEDQISLGAVDFTLTNKDTAYILGWRLPANSKAEYFAFGDKDDLDKLIRANYKYHDITPKQAIDTFDIAINRDPKGLVYTTSL